MVVDPPEDQVLLLLNALEFAIDKGNLGDARNRIRALRKLRQLGTQGCEDVERGGIRPSTGRGLVSYGSCLIVVFVGFVFFFLV
jgi:hypothetical protein